MVAAKLPGKTNCVCGRPSNWAIFNGSDAKSVNSDNHALDQYARGNAKPGGLSPVTGFDTGFSEGIAAMVQHMPPDIAARFAIESGYRSAERQHEVNPGVTHSMHTQGRAVDIVKDPAVIAWITSHSQYGYGFPLSGRIPHEENHMEQIGPTLWKDYTNGMTAARASSGTSVINNDIDNNHHINNITVNTQASDASGIGRSISDAVKSHLSSDAVAANANIPVAHAAIPAAPGS